MTEKGYFFMRIIQSPMPVTAKNSSNSASFGNLKQYQSWMKEFKKAAAKIPAGDTYSTLDFQDQSKVENPRFPMPLPRIQQWLKRSKSFVAVPVQNVTDEFMYKKVK